MFCSVSSTLTIMAAWKKKKFFRLALQQFLYLNHRRVLWMYLLYFMFHNVVSY